MCVCVCVCVCVCACQVLASKLKPNLGNFENPPDWQEILSYFRGSELQNYFTKVRPACWVGGEVQSKLPFRLLPPRLPVQRPTGDPTKLPGKQVCAAPCCCTDNKTSNPKTPTA